VSSILGAESARSISSLSLPVRLEHRSGEHQGLKARPHALNRFALARKEFIVHFWPSPALAPAKGKRETAAWAFRSKRGPGLTPTSSPRNY
jgi:hypothetical protein